MGFKWLPAGQACPVTVLKTVRSFIRIFSMPFSMIETAGLPAGGPASDAFVDRLNTGRSRPGTGRPATGGASQRAAFRIASVRQGTTKEVGIALIDLSALHRVELVHIRDSHGFVDTMELLRGFSPAEVIFGKVNKGRGWGLGGVEATRGEGARRFAPTLRA